VERTYELEPVTWKRIPGGFELLEQDRLDDEQPAFDKLPTPSATRGWLGQEDFQTLKLRWQRFLQRLKGFSKDEIVAERQPLWVPLIDLHVPPGGRATVSYERMETARSGAGIKVLGSGFGSAGSVLLSEGFTFAAEGSGKSFQVKLLMTATKYTAANGQSIVRLDVDNEGDHMDARLVNLPTLDERNRFRSASEQGWKIVHRIRLSEASEAGYYTWKQGAQKRATWRAELGAPPFLVNVGVAPSLTLESEHGDDLTITFEVPYGQDYVFYSRRSESPLVPFCDIEEKES
jgi:hypothetical protein